MSDTTVAAAITGALAVFATAINRLVPRRSPRPPRKDTEERLDAERWRLLEEVRAELDECRERSDRLESAMRTERWRVAFLIRALQEAGIPVPKAALLDITYNPETNTYRIDDND